MYAAVGARPPELSMDRCAVLLAAGLPADALRDGEAAVSLLSTNRAAAARLADALVRAAESALAAGEIVTALNHAGEASRLFRKQGRERGLTAARLAEVRARFLLGESSARLLAVAARAAADAERHLPLETPAAHVLVARIALARGAAATAEPHLLKAARARYRGTAINRVVGWYATALRHEIHASRRGVLGACERGLAVINAHQLTLGGWEMRAAATSHGADLAGLALRQAVGRGDARALLRWSERWRATVLVAPPVLPPDDPRLAADLTALRETYKRSAEAPERPHALGRERRQLEDAVRRRSFTVAAQGDGLQHRFDVATLLAALGKRCLIEMTVVDDLVRVLVVGRGRVRRFTAGNVHDAMREVEYARFGLRAMTGGGARATRNRAMLAATATRLETQLLGAAARAIWDDHPVIVIPPARMHSTPWALLPSLREQVFTVAPSAASWLRADQQQIPSNRRVVLVGGPDLTFGGEELKRLASRYPGATVLADGMATNERVLWALDGCWLAHFAAHGVFRADNPLFSTLMLDDGPLTLYDLQRLGAAPYRLVLSACETGVGAPTGVDELLGLTSVLTGLGTAGLLASVAPVSDHETADFSVLVHDAIAAGADLGHALLHAREAAVATDPVVEATALSFIAFGAS
jgi:CHAT domain